MNTELHDRVSKLEWRADQTDTAVKALADNSKAQGETLGQIKKTLDQIKWIATGAAIAFIGKSFGLEKLLGLLF